MTDIVRWLSYLNVSYGTKYDHITVEFVILLQKLFGMTAQSLVN
jgi:hypothetical protein